MLHVICTRLRPGHLSVRVGDGLGRSEEIVKKNLELRFSMLLSLFETWKVTQMNLLRQTERHW